MELPTLIANFKATKIRCGDNHSLAIDDKGMAYGWGMLDHGAIGVRITVSYEPGVIKFPCLKPNSRIKEISTGRNHSCFLTDMGDAYSCGANSKGQLGIGFMTDKEFRTIIIRLRDNFEPITQVECGTYHTCFLTKSGKVFSTGLNDEGQLGLGHRRNISWPEWIEIDAGGQEVNFKKISCGRYSSAIDHKGYFYAWGCFKNRMNIRPFCPDSV